MKIVVTHASPDLDAIASVWLIKKFLPGWEDAQLQFVSAGERIGKESAARLPHIANDARPTQSENQTKDSSSLNESRSKNDKFNSAQSRGSAFSSFASGQSASLVKVIEEISGNEIIHVDTGNGPLDHHLTGDNTISAASLTLNFLKQEFTKHNIQTHEEKIQALERMVKIIVEIDHFKEIFWAEPLALYHDFSLIAILDGLKFEKPNDDLFYVDFISKCFDALLHQFENRIWAEKEITEKGVEFQTKWGKGIGIETINDSVLKLAQKMDYIIVVRRDPRKGYVRVKAKPSSESQKSKVKSQNNEEVDLTLVYEQLKKMDPEATWFLHVSKKMLLNGTVKNPKMKPTTLSLEEIIKVLEKV